MDIFCFASSIRFICYPKLNKQIFEYDKKRNNLERKGEYAQRVLYLKDYAKDVRLTKKQK